MIAQTNPAAPASSATGPRVVVGDTAAAAMAGELDPAYMCVETSSLLLHLLAEIVRSPGASRGWWVLA
eukprot:COSAG06_NODE_10547_length_1661_cov_0.969270_1_plen_68_part_00